MTTNSINHPNPKLPAPTRSRMKSFEALKHWSNFGRRGTPAKKRVLASDWQNKAFEKPLTATWDQVVPRTEIPKIINGFQPREMEDKWSVYADGPDANGKVNLHMHRSWTGHKMFEVEMVMEMTEDFEPADKDAQFTKIMWETDEERKRGATEDNSKEMVKEVCKWCLDVQLP